MAKPHYTAGQVAEELRKRQGLGAAMDQAQAGAGSRAGAAADAVRPTLRSGYAGYNPSSAGTTVGRAAANVSKLGRLGRGGVYGAAFGAGYYAGQNIPWERLPDVKRRLDEMGTSNIRGANTPTEDVSKLRARLAESGFGPEALGEGASDPVAPSGTPTPNVAPTPAPEEEPEAPRIREPEFEGAASFNTNIPGIRRLQKFDVEDSVPLFTDATDTQLGVRTVGGADFKPMKGGVKDPGTNSMSSAAGIRAGQTPWYANDVGGPGLHAARMAALQRGESLGGGGGRDFFGSLAQFGVDQAAKGSGLRAAKMAQMQADIDAKNRANDLAERRLGFDERNALVQRQTDAFKAGSEAEGRQAELARKRREDEAQFAEKYRADVSNPETAEAAKASTYALAMDPERGGVAKDYADQQLAEELKEIGRASVGNILSPGRRGPVEGLADWFNEESPKVTGFEYGDDFKVQRGMGGNDIIFVKNKKGAFVNLGRLDDLSPEARRYMTNKMMTSKRPQK